MSSKSTPSAVSPARVPRSQHDRVRNRVGWRNRLAHFQGSSIELDFGALPYPDYEPMAFWGDRRKLDRCLETTDGPV